MKRQDGKWIKVEKTLPDEGELVLMECLQPLDGSILRKICYEIGLRVGPDGMHASHLTEHEDNVDVGTYEHDDDDDSIILVEGFYRVYDHWDGTHIQDPAGEVVRWMSFPRR